MSRKMQAFSMLALLAGLGFWPLQAWAQVSTPTNVVLNAAMPTSLTVLVTAGNTVSFNPLVVGSTTNGTPVTTIQVSWQLSPGLKVSLYGYFNLPAQALADGAGNNIPSSRVRGRVPTGIPTSFVAFDQTNPLGPAGGSLLLLEEDIIDANTTGSRTDNLKLQIDLAAFPLPPGNYSGTLVLQARAI